MVLLQLSTFPLDQRESLTPCAGRSLDIIDASGPDYRCGAMGTMLEGELDQGPDVVRRCFVAMAADCHRVECSVELGGRKGCRDASTRTCKPWRRSWGAGRSSSVGGCGYSRAQSSG